jgi:hypothetical protein
MITVSYKTKKELKQNIGKELHYSETSVFGPEYKSNGNFCVAGLSPYKRKWLAIVTMENNIIKRVQ